jgi:hypothetical protein
MAVLVAQDPVDRAARLAMVISQAPGLRGTPSAGHCSSAATSASWASSSATSRSRTLDE